MSESPCGDTTATVRECLAIGQIECYGCYMTRTIPHRELRNNSSSVLREVRDGETVNITNGGELVAVLSPPPVEGGPSNLRVKSAARRGGFDEIQSVEIQGSTQDLLDDLRGER